VRSRKGDQPGPKRPTLTDVAALAGVSMMTASRAMNGERYVSAAATEKVRAAAAELGFVPHQGARSLATNRTDSVALIAPMAGERFFNDPNIAPMIAGASSRLTELGSQLVVLIAGGSEQADRARDHVLARHVDGAIILSPQIIPDVMEKLLDANVPLAATGSLDERPGLDVVDVDIESAVARSVQRLLDEGCTAIGLIAGPLDDPRSQLQYAAYDRELPAAHPRTVARGDYSVRAGSTAAGELLGAGRVDGLVVCGDAMAVGAITTLQEQGLRVPEDVKVIGFDDSSLAETTVPPLTTTRVPFFDIGARMAELVWERVREPGRPGSRTVVDSTLIVRSSG
jgi:LacI family transcriptional regulator